MTASLRPPSRRAVLALGLAGAIPGLSGCATPLPIVEAPPPASGGEDGSALLLRSAEAHGWAAYRRLRDINVRYEGEWRPLIDRIQPVVVDKAHRGASEERLIPSAGVVAQAYTGPAGRKHVRWQRAPSAPSGGDVAVWFGDRPSTDPQVLDAAALVAEGYGLFLLGPLWLAGRGHASRRAGSERVDGRACEVVNVWMRPGLGRAPLDRVSLCIDPAGIMRRVRFTLEGFANTRGAVAQVDTYDHERRFGVLWPMRSYEEVVHPLRLPAHDWRIAGLDVDRGYDASALAGPAFSGAAARPAAVI